jgi:hypothetical protein
VKASPLQGWKSPEGLRKFSFPEFPDNRHNKAAGLSTLSTGCLYHLENNPGTHFCWGTLLVAQLVEALHYKPESRGLDSQ